MRLRLSVVAFLLCLLGLPIFGQTFGDISGEIKDSSGAAIAGVKVTVTNTDTNVTRNAESNESGAYSFPALVPGPYSVRAEKQGFKSEARTGITLEVQASPCIDITMNVGQVSETVEVSAACSAALNR